MCFGVGNKSIIVKKCVPRQLNLLYHMHKHTHAYAQHFASGTNHTFACKVRVRIANNFCISSAHIFILCHFHQFSSGLRSTPIIIFQTGRQTTLRRRFSLENIHTRARTHTKTTEHSCIRTHTRASKWKSREREKEKRQIRNKYKKDTKVSLKIRAKWEGT